MKILVTVLLTALLVFALATTWVDFVQPQMEKQAVATTSNPDIASAAAASKKRLRKAAAQTASELLPVPADEAAEPAPIAETRRPLHEPAPVPARKLDEMLREESQLSSRRETLRMIYDDIRAEVTAVDEIRKQTSEDLAEADRQVRNVAQIGSPPPPSGRDSSRPSRGSGGSQAMRDEALFIRRLAQEGKIQTAVSVLKSMKSGYAAGVLTALSGLDSKLADRLADTLVAEMLQVDTLPTEAVPTGTSPNRNVQAGNVQARRGEAVRR